MTNTDVTEFLARRAELVQRMGLRTVSEYLADPNRVEDPNPRAGTDWEESF